MVIIIYNILTRHLKALIVKPEVGLHLVGTEERANHGEQCDYDYIKVKL
jgi:hypothetical protein